MRESARENGPAAAISDAAKAFDRMCRSREVDTILQTALHERSTADGPARAGLQAAVDALRALDAEVGGELSSGATVFGMLAALLSFYGLQPPPGVQTNKAEGEPASVAKREAAAATWSVVDENESGLRKETVDRIRMQLGNGFSDGYEVQAKHTEEVNATSTEVQGELPPSELPPTAPALATNPHLAFLLASSGGASPANPHLAFKLAERRRAVMGTAATAAPAADMVDGDSGVAKAEAADPMATTTDDLKHDVPLGHHLGRRLSIGDDTTRVAALPLDELFNLPDSIRSDQLAGWDIDILGVPNATQLMAVAANVFRESGCLDAFNVSPSTLANFLAECATRYRPNPYHNFNHGCHVLQGCE